MDPSFFTVGDVATRWGTSQKLVRGLIATGQRKAIRLGNKVIQVPADALEEYETRNKEEAKK